MNAKKLAKLNARAEADRAGYPGSIGYEVISTPILGEDGLPILHHVNSERPGPLDGKPRCVHTARFIYADRTVVRIDENGNKSRRWPGGPEVIKA